jgi:hypothetical protein
MPPAFGAWLRPVERTVRVREVPSSNLGAPTKDLTANRFRVAVRSEASSKLLPIDVW